MKHSTIRRRRRKNQPVVPKFLTSPLGLNLLNLIPLFLVISVFGINATSLWVRDFKSVALTQDGKAENLTQLALKAAAGADLVLAQSLHAQAQINQGPAVLGARSDLEQIIFPKQTLEKEISNLNSLANLIPSRALYLKLALLHWRNYETQKAKNYLNLAIAIDPNDSNIPAVEKILNY